MGRVYEDADAVYEGTQSNDDVDLYPEYDGEEEEFDEETENIRTKPLTAQDAIKYGVADTGYNDQVFFDASKRVVMSIETLEYLRDLKRRVRALPDNTPITGRLKDEISAFPFLGGSAFNQSYDPMGEYECWDLFRECYKKEPAVSMEGPDGLKLKGDKRPFSKPMAAFIAWRLMVPKIIKDFTTSYLRRNDVTDSYNDFPAYYDEAFLVIYREMGSWNPGGANFAHFITGPLKNISKVYGRESKSISDYIRTQYNYKTVSWNVLTNNVEKDTSDIPFHTNTDAGVDPITVVIQKEQEQIKKAGKDVLVYICGMNISEYNNFSLDINGQQKKQLLEIDGAKISDTEKQKRIRQVLEQTPENIKDVPKDALFILKTGVETDVFTKEKYSTVAIGVVPSREQIVRMNTFKNLYTAAHVQWKDDLLDRIRDAALERGISNDNLRYCLKNLMEEIMEEEEEEYGDYDL